VDEIYKEMAALGIEDPYLIGDLLNIDQGQVDELQGDKIPRTDESGIEEPLSSGE
jgi:hypothetical protein